jgi:hypothetical protein
MKYLGTFPISWAKNKTGRPLQGTHCGVNDHSQSTEESDSDSDSSEEKDGITAIFNMQYGAADQAPTESKTQLLKPNERLSQKASLMEIFKARGIE